MPDWALRIYERALPRIRAQVQLFNMQAAAYPYMKQQDADRTWAELRRTAYPAADRAVKPETRADLERMAEAVGIKVIR